MNHDEKLLSKQMQLKLETLAEELQEQNEFLQALRDASSLSSRTINGMPKSKKIDNGAEANRVIALLEAERRKKCIERRIEARISVLKENDLRNVPQKMRVLRLRYISGLEWADIASLMFGECPDFAARNDSYMRKVYRWHVSACFEIGQYFENKTGRKNYDYDKE